MNQVSPFAKRINASESICSFELGLIIPMENASIFLRVLAFDGALHKILGAKQWSMSSVQDAQLVFTS